MPENLEAVKKLLRESREAAFATLEEGKPFTSAINYFWEEGTAGYGKLCLLMSDLARHAKNAKSSPHVSLLIAERGETPIYERKRVSVQGLLSPVMNAELTSHYKTRYLSLFPKSQIFFTLADFHFFEIQISEIYFIGGFGKAESFK